MECCFVVPSANALDTALEDLSSSIPFGPIFLHNLKQYEGARMMPQELATLLKRLATHVTGSANPRGEKLHSNLLCYARILLADMSDDFCAETYMHINSTSVALC